VSNQGCKCKAVLEPCHVCSCEVFGKTFAASKVFTNALQGCNRKLLMTSMVDITLFVSSFSIYVILLNLNVLLAVRNSSQYSINTINSYAICPDRGARFNCGPGRAASKYHLACVELEQVLKNWTRTSCTSSGTGRGNRR